MASTGRNMQLFIIQSLNTTHVTQLCLTAYHFSSLPCFGRNHRPKHGELIGIIKKILYCCMQLVVYIIISMMHCYTNIKYTWTNLIKIFQNKYLRVRAELPYSTLHHISSKPSHSIIVSEYSLSYHLNGRVSFIRQSVSRWVTQCGLRG